MLNTTVGRHEMGRGRKGRVLKDTMLTNPPVHFMTSYLQITSVSSSILQTAPHSAQCVWVLWNHFHLLDIFTTLQLRFSQNTPPAPSRSMSLPGAATYTYRGQLCNISNKHSLRWHVMSCVEDKNCRWKYWNGNKYKLYNSTDGAGYAYVVCGVSTGAQVTVIAILRFTQQDDEAAGDWAPMISQYAAVHQ